MVDHKINRDDLRDAINGAMQTIRPVSVDEQWRLVEDSYQEILNRQGEADPLTEAWHSLDGGVVIERGADLRELAETPLAALMLCFEMGFYPPPELAVAVSTAYYVYRQGCGEISLEEAMHGRAAQRSGSASRRRQKRLRDLGIRMEFAAALRRGLSRPEAAEHAQSKVPDAPDADSILRMLRGWPGDEALRVLRDWDETEK